MPIDYRSLKRKATLITLWALYSILWIGGVVAHLWLGGTPADTGWAAPAFLSLAGLIVIVSTPSDRRALGIAAGAGFCSEVMGVHLGIPFGQYVYTPALGCFVFGVPLVLLFAWMVLIAFVRQWRWSAFGSAALMVAIDLVIDPVASRTLGYWKWITTGIYYGVPLVNFAGWFGVSAIIFAIAPGVAPPSRSVKATGISILLFFALIGFIHGLYLPGTIGLLVVAACWWLPRVFCSGVLGQVRRQTPNRQDIRLICEMDQKKEGPTAETAEPVLNAFRLFENLDDPFLVLDRDWRVLYSNPAAAQLHRKAPEEFLGKTFWAQWPTMAGTEIERQFRLAIEHDVSVRFEHGYRENGLDGWLDIHAYPTAEGLAIHCRNISDRKKIEQVFALSDQRFRGALSHTSIVLFEQDRDLRYTWIYNSRSIYPPELSLGKTDREVMPGEYGERLMSLKQRVIEDERGTSCEVAIPLPDATIHYDLLLEPLRDDLGSVRGLMGTAVDISERKRAEETLLSLSLLIARIGTVLGSDAELERTLDQCATLLLTGLDAAFVRIWLLNEKENVLELFVSQGQYTHLTGSHSRIRVGDFKIGLIAQERKPHLTNSVVGDERVADQEWARREGMVAFAGYPLIAGQRLEGVLALFSRKALSEAIHLSLSAISDGIAAAIERKRSEREVRELQDRTRQVLESISDAFFALDRDWIFTYANRHFEKLTGRSFGQIAGKNFWREFPETAGTPYEHHYREAIRTGKPTLFETHDAPLKLWSEVHAYPSERGLSIYIQNISERKRLEQKLIDAAKLESLGLMAGGIAHDFNNLLTGILGNASLLLDLPAAEDRQLAGDIVKASERAADLTRQMLAYSGKGRFEVRATGLSALVQEILPLLKPAIDKRVDIELNLGEKLPCVEGDPSQFQQLIMNLVINAAESIGEARGGRVTITTGVAEVDETFIAHTFSDGEIAPGWYVFLEVQDTGCGMTEETKGKMFDPFFTTKFTGRGLGLAAVSGIVRGHKGALRVYSSPGEGTTFKVFLPALDVKEEETRAASKSDTHQGHGTILLVDDEETVRRVGRTSLVRQGYKVLLANNGKEAIQVFESRATEIALVVLDMTMPVMGGEEALGRLREIRPDIPVIVSSGYNAVEVIRRFTSGNIAGFIQKPYTSSALTGKVKAVLEGTATHV